MDWLINKKLDHAIMSRYSDRGNRTQSGIGIGLVKSAQSLSNCSEQLLISKRLLVQFDSSML